MSPKTACEKCGALTWGDLCVSCDDEQTTWGDADETGATTSADDATDMSPDDRDTTDMRTDDGTETATVGELLRDALEYDELHAVNATGRNEGAVYLNVVRTCSWGAVNDDERDVDVFDSRTVVVDLDAETVRVSKNGEWVLKNADAATVKGRAWIRAANDERGACDDDEPMKVDATGEVDVDGILSQSFEVPESRDGQNVDRMKRDPGISPTRSWGYGGNPPSEIQEVVDRLEAHGLDPSKRLFRLEWGKKKPHHTETVDKSKEPPQRGRPVDELKGNYGIDTLSQDEGLVYVDVDYPEVFERMTDDVGDVPETFAISSPHGSDDRRHMVFYCPNKDDLADEIDAWSVQDVTYDGEVWGDFWAGGNRFIVGAGSQLSAYGCNTDGFERDERGACATCEDEDGGYYEVVNDAPIADVDAASLARLVPEEVEEEQDASNGVSGAVPDDGDGVTCLSCGRTVPEDEADEKMKDAASGYICRKGTGGCT